MRSSGFWRIRLYTSSDGEFVPDTSFRVLLSTNAANVGIDRNHIDIIVRFGLPRDLMTYFQERGRGARKPRSTAECVLYASMSSFVSIMTQILSYNKLTDTTDLTNEELEIRGAESAITPLAASAQRQLERRRNKSKKNSQDTPKQPKSKYRLSHSMRRQLRQRMISEINGVLRVFSSTSDACITEVPLSCLQVFWTVILKQPGKHIVRPVPFVPTNGTRRTYLSIVLRSFLSLIPTQGDLHFHSLLTSRLLYQQYFQLVLTGSSGFSTKQHALSWFVK